METRWYIWFLGHTWAIEVFVVLFLLLMTNYLVKRLLSHSKRQSELKEDDWRMKLDYAALVPTRILLWVLLISFLGDLIIREYALQGVFTYVGTFRNVLIVLCLSWFLLRWKKVFYISMASRRVNGKANFDPASLEIAGKVFTISVIFVALLTILQFLGLNILPLVTFGGIGAAALGIAGRDVIANFFGGLMLYITRPFTGGDLIELPQKQLTGHIEEIGWYFTSIRDLQKKPIYIPNAIFSTEVLINLSRMTHRRIEDLIQIRYEDISKVSSIIELIQALLDGSAEIDHHQPLHVFLKTLGTYAVGIEIQAYVRSTRYEDFMRIKGKLLLDIYDLVIQSGAVMPYPIMSVEVKAPDTPIAR